MDHTWTTRYSCSRGFGRASLFCSGRMAGGSDNTRGHTRVHRTVITHCASLAAHWFHTWLYDACRTIPSMPPMISRTLRRMPDLFGAFPPRTIFIAPRARAHTHTLATHTAPHHAPHGLRARANIYVVVSMPYPDVDVDLYDSLRSFVWTCDIPWLFALCLPHVVVEPDVDSLPTRYGVNLQPGAAFTCRISCAYGGKLVLTNVCCVILFQERVVADCMVHPIARSCPRTHGRTRFKCGSSVGLFTVGSPDSCAFIADPQF